MFNCSFAWTFWTFCSKAWVVLEHLNNLFIRMNIKYFNVDCIFAHQIDANQFVISAIFHFKSVSNYWINFVRDGWRLNLIRSCSFFFWYFLEVHNISTYKSRNIWIYKKWNFCTLYKSSYESQNTKILMNSKKWQKEIILLKLQLHLNPIAKSASK